MESPRKLVSAIQLLHEIVQEPVIARFIQGADFKHERSIGNCEPELVEMFEKLRTDTESNAGLLRLLKESSYLRAAGQDPAVWLDMILNDEGEGHKYATTLLLTLLPNVGELAYPAPWNYLDPELWSVLHVIVKRANDSANGTASLAKLRTLKPMDHTNCDYCYPMRNVTLFLAIHSIRKFYGAGLVAISDEYSNFDIEPCYERFGINLVHIELAACFFDSQGLARFFNHMFRLKTFKFSYTTKWYGRGCNCNAGASVAALIAGTGQTLENLALYNIHHRGSISTGVTNMTGFEKLKNLELDITWLHGPPYDQFVGIDDVDIKPGEPVVPCLVDLLPSSIEKLQILAGTSVGSMNCLHRLFTDFVSDKCTRLPNLSSVKIRLSRNMSVQSFPEVVSSACDSGDVQVVIQDKHWQREYEDGFLERFGVVC